MPTVEKQFLTLLTELTNKYKILLSNSQRAELAKLFKRHNLVYGETDYKGEMLLRKVVQIISMDGDMPVSTAWKDSEVVFAEQKEKVDKTLLKLKY